MSLLPINQVYFSSYEPTACLSEYRKDEDALEWGSELTLWVKRELSLLLESLVMVVDKPSEILANIRTNILFSDNAFAKLAGIDYLSVRALKDLVSCLASAVTAMAKR